MFLYAKTDTGTSIETTATTAIIVIIYLLFTDIPPFKIIISHIP